MIALIWNDEKDLKILHMRKLFKKLLNITRLVYHSVPGMWNEFFCLWCWWHFQYINVSWKGGRHSVCLRFIRESCYLANSNTFAKNYWLSFYVWKDLRKFQFKLWTIDAVSCPALAFVTNLSTSFSLTHKNNKIKCSIFLFLFSVNLFALLKICF